MTAPQRLIALLVPWLFVAIFATLYSLLLVPRLVDGHVLGVLFAAFVSVVLVCFIVAAATFSRDVLTGHWPPGDRS